jgi:3-oxoacyl-[acyl-carrier protein] reductase
MSGETRVGSRQDVGGTGRPLALVTGAGRSAGIAASVVLNLAQAGWTPYGARMQWGKESGAPGELQKKVASLGARIFAAEADLSDPAVPIQLFDSVERELGNVTALVLTAPWQCAGAPPACSSTASTATCTCDALATRWNGH